jgi:hypothetical protein
MAAAGFKRLEGTGEGSIGGAAPFPDAGTGASGKVGSLAVMAVPAGIPLRLEGTGGSLSDLFSL